MACDTFQAAISSRIDGEPMGVSDEALDDHLARCGGCRTFTLDSRRLRRVTADVGYAPAPDVAPAVMRRVAHQQTTGPLVTVVRTITALLGLFQFVIAVPLIASGGHASHETRHIGAFSVALGVGLLYAAWRPHRAAGLLPAVATLSVAMLVTCALSLSAGILPNHAELSHLVAPLAVLGLWAISHTGRAVLRPRPQLRSVA